MRLGQLQNRFVASLVLDATDPTFFANLVPVYPSACTVHQRFALYRNNLRESLVKTLKNIYPVCLCLLGDKCFSGLSRQFIRQTVSTHFSLNAFGGDFSEFIIPFSKTWSLPYLPEVAALEWIIHHTLLAPDNSQLSLQTLQHIPEDKQDEVIFGLAENATLFASDFPVDSIWSEHHNKYEILTNNIEDAVNLFPEQNLAVGDTRLLIYRDPTCALCLVRLTSLEWKLLQGIALEYPLHRLYENFSEEEAIALIATLMSCLQKGYITQFSVSSKEIIAA